MKLYYDNLIAYMPSSVIVDGKPIPDSKLDAARKAMMLLAEFQVTQNVRALYESVYQVSIYADINIVDLILSLSDIEIEAGRLDDLLDIAAKNLFKTVTPNFDPKTFDYKYYSAILLSVAHTVWVVQNTQNPEPQVRPAEEVTSISEDATQ